MRLTCGNSPAAARGTVSVPAGRRGRDRFGGFRSPWRRTASFRRRGGEWPYGRFGRAGAALAVHGAARRRPAAGPVHPQDLRPAHARELRHRRHRRRRRGVPPRRGRAVRRGRERSRWSIPTRRTPAGPGVPEGWRYGARLSVARAGGRDRRRDHRDPRHPRLRPAGARRPVRRRASSTRCCAPPRRATRSPPTPCCGSPSTRLLRLNGGAAAAAGRADGRGRVAARARAVLEERMADPPTLERLAADLGTGPFALLRAFRDAYGMPPHTWLTDARVRRARRLLDAGTAPAEAAVAVGFTDQPHLNRHFTRIVGVPPGRVPAGAQERTRRGPATARTVRRVAEQTASADIRAGAKGPSRRGRRGSRTPPSYGTPSASGSPSGSPGSPSG